MLSIEIKIIGSKIGNANIGSKELFEDAFVIIADKIVVDAEIDKLPKNKAITKIEYVLIKKLLKNINIKSAIITLVNNDNEALKSNLPK